MRTPSVGIASEGWPFIGLSAFTAFLAALLGWWAPAVLFWLLCVFSVYFFRDPERVIAQGEDIAVSPADGRVVSISTRKEPFTGEEAECISIFMSVFNVHVNRAPVACEVKAIGYFEGKFLNASLDKASEENERCAWLLEGNGGLTWVMVQIAGLIARRIVCRAEVGDHLARGERLGLIRFGSRVDLYLPRGYSPAVTPGTKVTGGQTVIARKA